MPESKGESYKRTLEAAIRQGQQERLIDDQPDKRSVKGRRLKRPLKGRYK